MKAWNVDAAQGSLSSMQVNFYTKWHKGRGDQQVIMQKWGKHPHHGRVRDLQFQVKIKGVSAPDLKL